MKPDYQHMTLAELLDMAKARHYLHVLLAPEVDLHVALVEYLRTIESLYSQATAH